MRTRVYSAWPAESNGEPKSLGELNELERSLATELCTRGQARPNNRIRQELEIFVDEQTFAAEDRLANGADMNDDGTDFA